MWLSLILIAGFFAWALAIWHAAPPLISDKELESEEFRYCYATTPLRRLLVMLGSCLLFALIMWLLAYAITYLIWLELLARLFENKNPWYYLVVVLAVIGLVAISHLPKLKRFLLEVCGFFQRCQFFPMLPSPKEENLMGQIAKLPVGKLPREIEQALNTDPETLTEFRIKRVYDQYRRLEVLYQELRALAKKRKGIVRRFYFGSEWDLIDSQFKAIDRQMHSNNSDADEALAKKIHTCQYYCYGLLTRVIMETTTSAEESREMFHYYGFDVHLSE